MMLIFKAWVDIAIGNVLGNAQGRELSIEQPESILQEICRELPHVASTII